MRARDGMSQMPPLGSKRVDAAALELISAWVVDELPRSCPRAEDQIP
jgi:hypothetical protein